MSRIFSVSQKTTAEFLIILKLSLPSGYFFDHVNHATDHYNRKLTAILLHISFVLKVGIINKRKAILLLNTDTGMYLAINAENYNNAQSEILRKNNYGETV